MKRIVIWNSKDKLGWRATDCRAGPSCKRYCFIRYAIYLYLNDTRRKTQNGIGTVFLINCTNNIYGSRQEKFLWDLIHFHFMVLFDPPWSTKSWPKGHGLHNFSRGIPAHHDNVLILYSADCPVVEKIFF